MLLLLKRKWFSVHRDIRDANGFVHVCGFCCFRSASGLAVIWSRNDRTCMATNGVNPSNSAFPSVCLHSFACVCVIAFFVPSVSLWQVPMIPMLF